MSERKLTESGFQVDYPAEDEIQAQKRQILAKAFPRMNRLDMGTVFYGSWLLLPIGLMIYAVCVILCVGLAPDPEAGALSAMMAFPVIYFSFFFLSLLSEEQEGMVELKQTMRYSMLYLVSARVLAASVLDILVNVGTFLFLIEDKVDSWSVGAAGASAMFIMALLFLIIYERTGRVKFTAAVFGGWVLVCCMGLRFRTPVYAFITETVPLAVHIGVVILCFAALLNYIRKVERRIAYNI